MKSRGYVLILATLMSVAPGTLLLACHHEQPQEHHGSDSHEHKSTLQLERDAGRKWKTDDHTRKSMQQISRLVANEPSEGLEAYRALGSEVAKVNQTLIAGCTMTGPAHDNLHVFLTRFMPAVGALQGAKSLEEGQASLGELRKTLEVYDTYFE